jgi:hypothetical protein
MGTALHKPRCITLREHGDKPQDFVLLDSNLNEISSFTLPNNLKIIKRLNTDAFLCQTKELERVNFCIMSLSKRGIQYKSQYLDHSATIRDVGPFYLLIHAKNYEEKFICNHSFERVPDFDFSAIVFLYDDYVAISSSSCDSITIRSLNHGVVRIIDLPSLFICELYSLNNGVLIVQSLSGGRYSYHAIDINSGRFIHQNEFSKCTGDELQVMENIVYIPSRVMRVERDAIQVFSVGRIQGHTPMELMGSFIVYSVHSPTLNWIDLRSGEQHKIDIELPYTESYNGPRISISDNQLIVTRRRFMDRGLIKYVKLLIDNDPSLAYPYDGDEVFDVFRVTLGNGTAKTKLIRKGVPGPTYLIPYEFKEKKCYWRITSDWRTDLHKDVSFSDCVVECRKKIVVGRGTRNQNQ